MQGWDKFFEVLKTPINVVIGLCTAATFVLFAPDALITEIGLTEFKTQYKDYFGISFVLLIAIATARLVALIGRKISESKRLREGHKRLRELTAEEILVLAPYISGKTRTRNLPLHSGVVQGLVDEGIIYRSTEYSYGIGMAFAYNIQPWAWDYLNANADACLAGRIKIVEDK